MSFTTRNFDLSQDDEVRFEDQSPQNDEVTTPSEGGESVDEQPAGGEATETGETHPGVPEDVPLDEDTDFRALQRRESEHERLETEHESEAADKPADDGEPTSPLARTPLMLIGAALLTMLTGAAILKVFTTETFAQPATEVAPGPHDPTVHGQSFENSHENLDSVEEQVRREVARNNPNVVFNGPAPTGKLTWVNRKMMGHTRHDDHPDRSAAEAKRWQDKRMWRQSGVWGGAKKWEDAKSSNWQADHTRWPQRGGYGGAFITRPEYKKHYTNTNDFRIGGEPDMENGYAHFKHEGDHFVIVDPYPASWETKWHKSDDVYLEYDQGYYLHNRQHPGSPLAVMVLE